MQQDRQRRQLAGLVYVGEYGGVDRDLPLPIELTAAGAATTPIEDRSDPTLTTPGRDLMNERERAFQTALQSAIRNAAEAGEVAAPIGPGSDDFTITPQDLLDCPELFWVGGEAAEGAEWTPDVGTFEEAGVMSGNAGLVVTLPTGEQFQVRIVQSGFAPAADEARQASARAAEIGEPPLDPATTQAQQQRAPEGGR
jgi:hypothetical protein